MSLVRDRSTIGKLRQHVAMLERRLSYATDKQLLLLERLIEADARIAELERLVNKAR